MKETISNLRERYDFNLDKLIDLYAKNASLDEMTDEAVNGSTMNTRTILSTLNLRLKKRYRTDDLALFKVILEQNPSEIENKLQNMYYEVEHLQQELYKKEKIVRKLTVENNINKSMTRKALDAQHTHSSNL